MVEEDPMRGGVDVSPVDVLLDPTNVVVSNGGTENEEFVCPLGVV